MGVGMRHQPIGSREAQIRQKRDQFRELLGGIIMKNAYSVARPHRLHLRDHAAALKMALHQLAEFDSIVQCAATDEILDMSYEQAPFHILAFLHLAGLLQIALGGVDADDPGCRLLNCLPRIGNGNLIGNQPGGNLLAAPGRKVLGPLLFPGPLGNCRVADAPQAADLTDGKLTRPILAFHRLPVGLRP